MLIEDDDNLARQLTRALRSDGHRVIRAPIGRLDLAASTPFDLVILELAQPGADGSVVMHELLQEDPSQRLLILSTPDDTAAHVACFDAGVVDVVTKPLVLPEFLARVRARLRRPAPGPTTGWLKVGPVGLNLSQQGVELQGRRIRLSHREFLLLRHLMRRPGRVCTRQQLLQDVWDGQFDVGSNLVDVYIGRLRSKLDRPSRIETVRRLGYRFVAE